MLDSQRVPRTTAALLMSLALATTALIPLGGVASAQTQDYALRIQAPTSVPVLQEFIVRVGIIDELGIVKGGCPSRVPVTLTVTGESTWSKTVRASAGVARFRVSLPKLGQWTLTAGVPVGACDSTFRPGTDEVVAVRIPPNLSLPPCPLGVRCDLTSNSEFSAATLIAEDGEFTFGWQTSATIPGCGARPLDVTNGILSFDLSDKTIPKKVLLALAPKIAKGVGRVRVCWQGDGDAQGRLLKPCKNDDPPCVLFKKGMKRGAVLVGVLAPPGDPKLYLR